MIEVTQHACTRRQSRQTLPDQGPHCLCHLPSIHYVAFLSLQFPINEMSTRFITFYRYCNFHEISIQITRNTACFEHIQAPLCATCIMKVTSSYWQPGMMGDVCGSIGQHLYNCACFSVLIFYISRSQLCSHIRVELHHGLVSIAIT